MKAYLANRSTSAMHKKQIITLLALTVATPFALAQNYGNYGNYGYPPPPGAYQQAPVQAAPVQQQAQPQAAAPAPAAAPAAEPAPTPAPAATPAPVAASAEPAKPQAPAHTAPEQHRNPAPELHAPQGQASAQPGYGNPPANNQAWGPYGFNPNKGWGMPNNRGSSFNLNQPKDTARDMWHDATEWMYPKGEDVPPWDFWTNKNKNKRKFYGPPPGYYPGGGYGYPGGYGGYGYPMMPPQGYSQGYYPQPSNQGGFNVQPNR